MGKIMLEQDIKKILISHEEIVDAAKKLGQQLTKDYQGKNPIFVGILKGSVPFMAELIKHVDTHIELDFMLVPVTMVVLPAQVSLMLLKTLIKTLQDVIFYLLKILLILVRL